MDFGTVLIGVSVLAVLAAALSYWGSGRIYSGLGRSDLEMRREEPASSAEANEEIRQMLEAKSRRREARGEAPIDVEAELTLLTTGTPGPGDPALREVADQHDTTPGAIAVAWTLQNPAVDGAIVGFRRPDQVDAILAGADLELEAL